MKKTMNLMKCMVMVALMAAVCITVSSCGKDRDYELGDNSVKIIDKNILGKWEFDHSKNPTTGDIGHTWEFYANGVCSKKWSGAGFYTAKDGVLTVDFGSGPYTIYYRLKDGLLGFANEKDDPDEDISWYRKFADVPTE